MNSEDNDFLNIKVTKNMSRWDRLTEAQKEEFKKKAEEKRKQIEEEKAKRAYDIKTGKQKTMENAWD